MIKKTWSMTGKIVSGLGKGPYFVGLDHVGGLVELMKRVPEKETRKDY